jgi:CubicO group peptidase (beta-lactamase class C family)
LANPARYGPTTHRFALASLTKPLFSYAVLVAVEEGSLDLDQPAGPAGSTVRHLLAHASGLAPDLTPDLALDAGHQADSPGGPALAPISRVASKRIYSNHGFEVLGATLEQATGFSPAQYLHEAVCQPLGMTATSLDGSPAKDAVGTVEDLLRFGAELLDPRLISPTTLAEATTPQFPDLNGVLPGFGRQTPNPWGLGFEIRGTKSPHWTGSRNSPETYGHFGRSGTLLLHDPIVGGFLVVLTDKPFDRWAAEAWPPFIDAILAQAAGS